MKKQVRFILCFCIIAGLTSCNIPFGPDVSGQEVAQQYQTVSALLTATAQVTAVSPVVPTPQPATAQADTPLPQPELKPSLTPVTPSPASTRAAGTQVFQAVGIPCDLAQPGRPFDVTVPDDSRYHPGEYFSKTWRLVNAGTCTWTSEYAVIWFSGDSLGANRDQAFNANVPPGKSVDVTVDMIAPQNPGTYQSNWKLRSPQGALFGIGSNGGAPFWARVIVEPIDTPTVTPPAITPLPTATSTPAILAAGPLSLAPGEEVDLDSGKLNQKEGDDLIFERTVENKLRLAPLKDASLTPFGVTIPGLEECLLAVLSVTPVPLEQYQPGAYLCYRTNQGMPGRLLINTLDTQTGQLNLDFVTWSVP